MLISSHYNANVPDSFNQLLVAPSLFYHQLFSDDPVLETAG